MNINAGQLAINVNLHALQPDFLNSELHYVIAKSENSFRFATWRDEPAEDEKKFYCILTEAPFLIPAGNILLNESYVLNEDPSYPLLSDHSGFIEVIETLEKTNPAKCIRRFYDKDIDAIKKGLEDKYGTVEKHAVTSRQGQHLLFLIDNIEISIAAAMVYFRNKTVFNESHYKHILEEKSEE